MKILKWFSSKNKVNRIKVDKQGKQPENRDENKKNHPVQRQVLYSYIPSSSSSNMAGTTVGGEWGGAIPSYATKTPASPLGGWVSSILLIGGIFIAGLIFLVVLAAVLPDSGRTYPIAEKDLIEVIKTKAGELTQNELTFNHDLEGHLEKKFGEQPNILISAHENKIRYVDLMLTLNKDMTDDKGRIIAKKGERINPLEQVTLKTPLLFINSDDGAQLAWAKNEVIKNPSTKVILIAGNPLGLRKKWDREIYFDQDGKFAKRFELQALPSRVTQDGITLKVEEVAL